MRMTLLLRTHCSHCNKVLELQSMHDVTTAISVRCDFTLDDVFKEARKQGWFDHRRELYCSRECCFAKLGNAADLTSGRLSFGSAHKDAAMFAATLQHEEDDVPIPVSEWAATVAKAEQLLGPPRLDTP